jgi:hypothetical protein
VLVTFLFVILSEAKNPCISSLLLLVPFPQIYFQNHGMFLPPQKHHANHHKLPPIHHVLTTQKPRKSPTFRRTPLKNTTPKNYLPSRNRAASRSGNPAIKILPCAAVRS